MLGLELAPYSFSIDDNYYIYLHRYHHYNEIMGMCPCACVCELLMGGQWKALRTELELQGFEGQNSLVVSQASLMHSVP